MLKAIEKKIMNSDNDFVTVDNSDNDYVLPSSSGPVMEEQQSSLLLSSSTTNSSASRQRRSTTSLLQTLWSEATSTTDLPLHALTTSAYDQGGDRLHHRHHRGASNTTNLSATTSKFARGGNSTGSTTSRYSRYARTTRGARVARRVWSSAFAAFGASFVIGMHLFLYRIIFMGGSTSAPEGGGGGAGSSGGTPATTGIAMTNKYGNPILAQEDMKVTMTLDDARLRTLTPLNIDPINSDKYTIRINTYRRNEQLLLSINHHAKCESVAAIHVIWCDTENSPPNDVVNHGSGKVIIEYHAINSLNERFKILLVEDTTPTTLGILSLDDDVLRPCIALDTAFIRWTRHPERMVGFDARTHVIVPEVTNDNNAGDDNNNNNNNNNEDNNSGASENNNDMNDNDKTTRWKYGYMSTTETSNHYSMTLPRSSFIHRDYYDLYTRALPRSIYIYVAQNLECEDVAMSFLISSLTYGKPPLLADYWAVKSMSKLYSRTKISGGKDHKATRDACVNDFASLLELKEDGKYPLQFGKLLHSGDKRFFGYGAEEEEWTSIANNNNDGDSIMLSKRLLDVVATMQKLRTSRTNEEHMAWLNKEKNIAQMEARSVGMIENTPEWRARWVVSG